VPAIRHRLHFLRAALGLLLLFGTVHCSSVLGIEDAKCDEALPDCERDGPSPLCRDYCAKVMANCREDNAVYEGIATCYAVCKNLEPGVAGDDSGNTTRCRLHQAEQAGPEGVNEPKQHCPGAGPGGEGPNGELLCADNCDGYCSIMQAVCDDYGSLETCRAACNQVPDLGGYNTAHSEGDSVQCRLWHVSAAADEPNPHCLHAAGKSYCAP
jgi:hypothetical protein